MEPTLMLNVNQRIKLYMYFNTKLIWDYIDLKVILSMKKNTESINLTSKIGMKEVLVMLISKHLL